MRRLIAFRLALRGLRTTDLRYVVGYDEAIRRAEQAEAIVRQHEDLLASIALYIKWRYVTKQLTTEQKNLFADALERDAFRIHGPDGEEPDPEMAGLPSYAPRWWQTENEDQFKDQPADSKKS